MCVHAPFPQLNSLKISYRHIFHWNASNKKKIKQKLVCETALNRLHLFSKLSNDELSYDVLRVEWTLSLNISNEMNVDWHNSEIILCSKSILKPYIIKFRFLFHCHRQIITVRIFHTNVWHCLVVSTSKNQTLPKRNLRFRITFSFTHTRHQHHRF